MNTTKKRNIYSVKFDRLLELEGLDEFEFGSPEIMDVMYDSIHPSICMNRWCDNTDYLEPDCSNGFCIECRTNSMMSFGELVMHQSWI